jgi:putative methyltransferase (TIGR04325 family)
MKILNNLKSVISQVKKACGFVLNQNHLEYSGPYKDWQSAIRNSVGYESNVVLEKVQSSTREVLENFAEYERDGTSFLSRPKRDTLRYLLEDLLVVGSRVIDFGGSLGGTYLANREFFKKINVCWTIIEQENFVRAGKKLSAEFKLPLRFELNATNDLLQDVDVLILSGVLQYIEDYKEKIGELIVLKPKYVVIDRTPVESGESQIFVQENPGYYTPKVSYPARNINRQELLDCFCNYSVIREWPSDFDPKNHRGFLLSLNS